ncbi:Kelch repeat-containing protein [Cystobacter ferrugineus]|uniref:Uncharacterized protein n=1 Tax=Cystobacter ferrugineus TaxID=83449 RepID=A0A1L9B877_9BACT|nr:kelch repeat-containing protein [Cystobacter ferrugineus]OJH38441.1 hypothetical protein BON30_25315 [Cystobacter ferrugineus]
MKRTMKFGALALLLAGGCVDSSFEKTAEPAASLSTPKAQSQALGTVTTSDGTGWARTGNMASAHLQQIAIRLQDGRVLAAGGYSQSAELYDPATGTWSPTGDAPASYRNATATLLPSGKVLVAGGNDLGISASLFDPASGTWTATGAMVSPRYYHTATLLKDGRVLVAGGSDGEYGGNVLGSAELYDPATGTWTAVAASSVARTQHTATLLASGKVLLAGGQGTVGLLNSAELYDPATGAWTAVGNLGTARSRHTATLLNNGQVLVTGGAADGEPSTRAELFDPATQTWSATSPMSNPRRLHTATLLGNGRVLVSGGYDDATGIQTAAELYDPVRGVWDAMPAMAVPRFQHTATLLSNGRVLVSGGISNSEQDSAEVFSAAQVKVVLDEGTGWQLINVSGANTDEVAPYDAELYVVGDEAGISNVPVSDAVRQHMADLSETKTTVFFLNKKVLDELRISEQQGAPTPYLQSIMEPMEPSLMGGDKCPDKVGRASKTFNFYKPLNLEKKLDEGLNGTLATKGDIEAEASAEVEVLKIREPFLFFGCVTAGFDLNHLKLEAHGALSYGATLEGTVTYDNAWQFPIVRPTLGVIAIPVGPVVIPIDVSLPITAGIDVKASTTGRISYDAKKSVSLDYTATCTFDGCESTTNFSSPPPSSPPVVASIQGRIEPSVWVQAAVRAGIFDAAYAQVGLRPYLDGDLWGYTGADCGDADGDGVQEFVQGGYFDLNWRLNVTAEVSALVFGTKEWPAIFSTGKQHIAFANLVTSVPGGWTPFDPILEGSATTGQYDNTVYSIRMRPCFPFPKDNEKAALIEERDNTINYRLEWDDGASEEFTGARFDEVFNKRHTWVTAGTRKPRITLLSDGHGRNYGTSYTRNITVTAQPGPTPHPEYNREVLLQGRLDALEDDAPDVRKTLWISDVAHLNPDSPTASFFYSMCVEDEVRAEVTVKLTLLNDNVTVKSEAAGKLFEEESCDNNSLEGEDSTEAISARDGNGQLHLYVRTTELFSTDDMTLDLTVTNNQAP